MRLLSVLTVCVAMAGPAYGWGPIGHRTTGAIAENHLNEKAQAAIRDLLGPETLAEAATWPDDMRSNPDPFWQKTASSWHYVTVPHGKSYEAVGAPDRGDAITALEQFSRTVTDESAPLADRQLALRFIVHIIGDLHQPLHVGNGTDRGGNDVKLKWFGKDSNLHSVWDSGLIDFEKLSYSELSAWLDSKITPEQVAQWSNTDPDIWMAESAALRDQIYPESGDLSWTYRYENVPHVKTRLSMGGIRIASYLNALFQ
ncbi:endonuclease [Iodidimonas gelatinilytica]|uniref:Endonuclease n=1 Tax=Iodidimonas gelatinilytica TaxID=1236966 RepID=A0A5A7MVF3_9PROT|nr:S1/P1 nuclease [Iodidimonas gelatinilytica]GEQ98875.1 endonuclease [Iodidimonas gelatinilytica]GER01670.1 endonuclease [Iodidimonas gelatinilytica]